MAKIVADQRARQGGQGRPVLYVLIGAFVLLGIAMAAFMIWSGVASPTSPQQAASEQSTGSISSSNTTKVPADNPAYPAPAAPQSGTPGSATSPRQ